MTVSLMSFFNYVPYIIVSLLRWLAFTRRIYVPLMQNRAGGSHDVSLISNSHAGRNEGYILLYRKLLQIYKVKNAVSAFFLGAKVAFPSEVLSSLERLRTFFIVYETCNDKWKV